jgi:hypothetical protein
MILFSISILLIIIHQKLRYFPKRIDAATTPDNKQFHYGNSSILILILIHLAAEVHEYSWTKMESSQSQLLFRVFNNFKIIPQDLVPQDLVLQTQILRCEFQRLNIILIVIASSSLITKRGLLFWLLGTSIAK